MNLLVFGNNEQKHSAADIKKLLTRLCAQGMNIHIESEFAQFLDACAPEPTLNAQRFTTKDLCGIDVKENKNSASSAQDDLREENCALSFGGDGTLLSTIMWVAERQLPVLGINTGHLGYLTATNLASAEDTFAELLAGKCRIEQRTMLSVSVDGATIEHPFALNEIAILRHESPSTIDMETFVDDTELTTYRGDGLVICTPTGSTAYNMSAGGPIVHPASPCLTLSPLAPHSLNMRPLVVPESAKIRVVTSSRSPYYQASIDGETLLCPSGTEVRIAKAPFSARIIYRESANFAHTLRQKLLWGTDQR